MERKQAFETTLVDDISDVIGVEDSESTQTEIARLKQELEFERERSLRLLAEFDHYRRRTRQERALAEQAGKKELLLAVLEVMDDFERALLHIGETSDPVAEGVRLICHRLNDVLHANGVTSFESEGKPFDPMVHEATSAIDSDEDHPGTVYAEYRRGYLINGELLRPARVAVLT